MFAPENNPSIAERLDRKLSFLSSEMAGGSTGFSSCDDCDGCWKLEACLVEVALEERLKARDICRW